MGLPSLDFADTDDDSPLRPIEQNFVRKPVKEVEKNETPRHIRKGKISIKIQFFFSKK